jgi:light-regulated signal transduction histidine kinase (bacteriophytochrome)
MGERCRTRAMYIDKVLNSTDRVIAMIEGILSYSTIGSKELPTETIDLNRIVNGIETDLEILIHQKNAIISKDELPEMEGAAVLISQLFYNVINNSLKFLKPDVPVVISITSSIESKNGVNYAKIRIEDNGLGFDPAQSEKIFNTFTRLNSKDKYEGTVLGLTLCKKITERHHGSISADGVKDKGPILTIWLPIKQSLNNI